MTKINVLSDQSSIGFRVGHWHDVQSTRHINQLRTQKCYIFILYAGCTEDWVFKRYSLYWLKKEVYGSLLIFIGIVSQSLDETKAKVEVT